MMQLYWLPQSVCTTIDHLCRSMLWSQGTRTRQWNLVSWKDVIKPKDYGGLAMRDTRSANTSLLGKLIWDLMHHPDKPWVSLLTHKYLHSSPLLNYVVPPGASQVWRSIHKALSVLRSGYGPCLGDGNSSFLYNNWTGTGSLCHVVPYVDIHDSHLKVSDLWLDNTWNLSMLYTSLPAPLCAQLTTISIPAHPVGADTISWYGSNNGIYTAASGYRWCLVL
uniref:Ribonuclease H protein At1g65750 family n=1 Tax=Cajanus cajan TaxID=3821 RepID=A0A151R062_CAJCA|nr:Putative ribonuclease H protein At1g65750 family [Cajanus cajan]